MKYGSYSDDFGGIDEEEGGASRDFDLDEESDREVESGVFASGRDGGGSGRARDDARGSALMAMTRRDPLRQTQELHRRSLKDMRSFLDERDSGVDPMQSVTSHAVTGLEILGGALAAGFLSQRFRQQGAMIPVGVTLGALGLIAAQFGMAGKLSPDLRNVAFGAAASAVALWAAGRGIISAEAAAPPGAAIPAGGGAFPQNPSGGATVQQPPMQPMQPPMAVPMQRPIAVPPMPQTGRFAPRAFPMPSAGAAFGSFRPMPAASALPSGFAGPHGEPMVAISMADFQNLVGRAA